MIFLAALYTRSVRTPYHQGEEDLSVELSAYGGDTIYYTTDGTDPTDASTKYKAPIQIPRTDRDRMVTVKAIAVKDGSLILSLTPEYLETLSEGEHTLQLYFADAGSPAEAVFTILREDVEPEPDPDTPSEPDAPSDPDTPSEPDTPPDPDTPSVPDTPSDSDAPSDQGPKPAPDPKGTDVRTGDDTPILPLILTMSGSAIATGVILVLKRRRRKEED